MNPWPILIAATALIAVLTGWLVRALFYRAITGVMERWQRLFRGEPVE